MIARRLPPARVGLRATCSLLLIGLFVGAHVVPFLARTALAAQHPYVTLLGATSDPIVLRLIPELMALGCAVRTDASVAPDPATFTEGDAVVRVTATTVTFWLVDPRSRRRRRREPLASMTEGPRGSFSRPCA